MALIISGLACSLNEAHGMHDALYKNNGTKLLLYSQQLLKIWNASKNRDCAALSTLKISGNPSISVKFYWNSSFLGRFSEKPSPNLELFQQTIDLHLIEHKQTRRPKNRGELYSKGERLE